MYSLPFQDSILQFIVQKPEGRSYIDLIDADLFDLAENQIMSDLLKAYFKEYKCLPRSEVNLSEFLARESKKTKGSVSEDVTIKLNKSVRKLFIPYDDDEPIVKTSIIEYKQFRENVKLFKEYATRIEEGVEATKEFHGKLAKVIALSEEMIDEGRNRGQMLLEDYNENDSTQLQDGQPVFLNAVNRMTAAKGFYSPQLVLWMGAPKSFKTGTMLNIAIDLVKQGLKVYYVDNENGLKAISNRAKQTLSEATREELRDEAEKAILTSIVGRVKVFGGEFVNDFYPAHQCCVADVERNLEYWKEKGFVPDVVCWDYPDLMLANRKDVRNDTQKNIQHVYFDIINFNSKHGVWSNALSQVNKLAVGKAVINMKDFAADFGKAMNCHAAFAICRTQEEEEAGTARIVPVVQREGVRQGMAECYVEMDEARMVIREVDHEQAAAIAMRKRRENNDNIFGDAPMTKRSMFDDIELPVSKSDREFFASNIPDQEQFMERKLVKLEGSFEDEDGLEKQVLTNTIDKRRIRFDEEDDDGLNNL